MWLLIFRAHLHIYFICTHFWDKWLQNHLLYSLNPINITNAEFNREIISVTHSVVLTCCRTKYGSHQITFDIVSNVLLLSNLILDIACLSNPEAILDRHERCSKIIIFYLFMCQIKEDCNMICCNEEWP